jgi:hypothetical protein
MNVRVLQHGWVLILVMERVPNLNCKHPVKGGAGHFEQVGRLLATLGGGHPDIDGGGHANWSTPCRVASS